MQNSMLMYTFSVFDQNNFFGQIWSKKTQEFMFKLEIRSLNNSNM